MSDVFISYSRSNVDFAEQLFDALKSRGMSAWVDWQNIPRSAGWWDEIKRGIDAATTFIFLVSNDSLSSAVCSLELAHAHANGKRIIPVIIQPPDFDAPIPVRPQDELFQQMLSGRDLFALARKLRTLLRERNWVQFINKDGAPRPFDDALAELLDTLKTDLEHSYRHARLLVRAREWENGQRDDDLLLIGEEITQAEAWLAETEERSKEPTPTDLHRKYIMTSRTVEDARLRRLRNIRRASVVASLIAVVAIVFAVVASLVGIQALALRQTVSDEREIVREFADSILTNDNNASQLISRMDKLVEQFPNYASAYQVRGLAYARLGNHEQAVNDYSKAIKLDPTNAVAYLNRGVAWRNLGNYEQAIRDYNQAIELDPMYAIAYNNRGIAYSSIGEYVRAIGDYSRAIELDPTYIYAYVSRGNAYGSLERYEEGLVDYQSAIQINPDYINAYWGLGNIYYEINRINDALENYHHYLASAGANASQFVRDRVAELEAVLLTPTPGQ